MVNICRSNKPCYAPGAVHCWGTNTPWLQAQRPWFILSLGIHCISLGYDMVITNTIFGCTPKHSTERPMKFVSPRTFGRDFSELNVFWFLECGRNQHWFFGGSQRIYIYRYTSLNQEVKRPRTSKHTGYIRKTVRKIISYKPELCSSTTLPTLE